MVACPTCGATGKYCRSAAGNQLPTPHVARLRAEGVATRQPRGEFRCDRSDCGAVYRTELALRRHQIQRERYPGPYGVCPAPARPVAPWWRDAVVTL